MDLNEFYYDLPKEFIANEPLKERQKSRLMVLKKNTYEIELKRFENIVDYLKKGDLLVLNDTRVIPARLIGEKKSTLGKIEFVLLKKLDIDTWEVILKPGKKAKVGSVFIFGNGILEAEIIDIIEDGNRIAKFRYDGIFEEILDEIGIIPLPPYINGHLDDKERYQTVYSKYCGSAAAPTAGLHFTKELLDELLLKGIEIAYVTLHIGLGTFRPVKVENILEHKMHSEYYNIDSENAAKINAAIKNNSRIIAVGTTACRVLESTVDDSGMISQGDGFTNIFIYPGYKFKIVNALITNFHLPESTLIMLVSAFAGKNEIFNAYKIAVQEKFRFFSFGDVMFIY